MDLPLIVRRCVCRNVSFEEILRVAPEVGYDFSAVAAATGAGTSCGMCRPYIRKVLQTRRPEQELLSSEEITSLMKQPERR